MTTLSYSHGTATKPLLGETIGANLDRTAQRHGEREALVSRHEGVRLTYSEFRDEVDRLARGLLARGIGRGDRVGIWSPNYAGWVILQYATARIGAILVTINPAYRVGELEHVLTDSGCRMLVAAERFKTSDYRAMVDDVRPRVRALEHVVFLRTPDWDDLVAAGDSVPPEDLAAAAAELDFDDAINIQYTSGTTGLPKGATLTHHNILNNGFLVGELCGYTEQDRVCLPVPLYHCFGMVLGNLAATTHGSCMVLPSDAFEPKSVLEAVAAEACTSLYGVPTMFIAELEHPDFAHYELHTLRTGIMAGAPCPEKVMRQVIDQMHMEEVTIAYGMTETSPVSTQTRRDDELERRVATVGRVHPHVEIKVVDPASEQTLPRGESGELWTRGYSVMQGYWNDPDRTADAITAHRWMRTGDLAVMDDDGYVQIVGRIKDMIIRGGENIYPREIEEYLYTHPAVADVQVVGVPDERFGEAVMAWVKLRDGADASEEDLRSYCRERIAHYKVPAYIRFTDEFPMTVTGKIQKYRLRELGMETLGTG